MFSIWTKRTDGNKGVGRIVYMSVGKVLSGEELRRLQLIQTELMVQVDALCRKHGISYVIACGSLLGAVRHKGFIPWDDDGDICMLREEYEKFRQVAGELDPEICWFQDHSTDEDYLWGYGKVRRTGTTYVRAGDEHLKARTGVYIDIFPMDDIPQSALGQVMDVGRCWTQRNILYAGVGKYSAGGIRKALFKMVSGIPPERVFHRLEKRTEKCHNDTSNDVRLLMFNLWDHERDHLLPYGYGMPKKWFLDRAEYEFEGHLLYGPKDYDAVLTYLYGDYMKLPPEEKRGPTAPPSSYQF